MTLRAKQTFVDMFLKEDWHLGQSNSEVVDVDENDGFGVSSRRSSASWPFAGTESGTDDCQKTGGRLFLPMIEMIDRSFLFLVEFCDCKES